MNRETCTTCEILFTDAIINNGNLENFLDWTIEDLDTNICIKCLSRITKRYENQS